MASYSWYWHRLLAMSPSEILSRVRKKCFEWSDQKRAPEWSVSELDRSGLFPRLPDPAAAPDDLREGVRRDVEAICAGRWRAFGFCPIQVDNPPGWHRDYLAGVDVETEGSAFALNHRELPGGADIKLVWELSRWHQVVRLAMAAWLRQDVVAGRTCLDWLEDWVAQNRPYFGWNWTSALEAGMRLVQFTWVDAWLRASVHAGELGSRLDAVGRVLLPAHCWFTWRHRSFGSSANNHLLGELAGLVLSGVRWPGLARWGVGLDRLQGLWEREVLAQFAPDGGNREQALNYHLYSLEFCLQTRSALLAAGRRIDPVVEERLGRAMDFYAEIQVDRDPWDYGDSDSAYVTWLFAGIDSAVAEWHSWLKESASSPALRFWLGDRPAPSPKPGWVGAGRHWRIYPDSGQAIGRAGGWTLRWDVSPLGYLSTAAHGHLDALHLSVWRCGVALVVDPGTGAYYSDLALRVDLASWQSHNGPHPPGLDFPRRLGPFLWSGRHPSPKVEEDGGGGLTGWLSLPMGKICRRIRYLPEKDGWEVDDQYLPDRSAAGAEFVVCWQFAPGTELVLMGEGCYRARRGGVAMEVQLAETWAEVEAIVAEGQAQPREGRTIPPGICSPGFGQRAFGPQLRVRAGGHNPCLLRTTFLACAGS